MRLARLLTLSWLLLLTSQLSAADYYWVSLITANWDNAANLKWSTTSGGVGGSGPPTASDDVHFDGSSGTATVTLNTGIAGRDATFTNFGGTLNNNVTWPIAGSLTLSSGMTWSFSGSINFTATDSRTLTTAGKTLGATGMTFNGVGGTWTLQDNIVSSTSQMVLTNGTLNTNGKSITFGSFASSNSNTRVLTISSSTITLTSSGTIWSMAIVTGLTLNASGSTIVFNNATASTKTFAGGGKTYGTLQLTGAGSGAFILSGSNTFSSLVLDTPPHTLTLTAATSQAVTGTLTLSGTSGNLLTIASSAAGSKASLRKSGAVNLDYLSLKDVAAEGGCWNAGTHSTNVSGNRGWLFETNNKCPAYAVAAGFGGM